jgi:hypothetical protein
VAGRDEGLLTDRDGALGREICGRGLGRETGRLIDGARPA